MYTIIDWCRKGNVIRFYLGSKTKDWGWTNKDYKDFTGDTPEWLKPSETYYGDDWDDAPFEHNAGSVYAEFIKGHFDVVADFEDYVWEPTGHNVSKEDLVAGAYPCIVIIPKEIVAEDPYAWFDRWEDIKPLLNRPGVRAYYLGQEAK